MTSSTKRFVSGHRFSDAESRNKNAPSGAAHSATSLGGPQSSDIAYFSTVTVAPVTSTIRGVPSEVVLNVVVNEEDGMKSPCAVNLHNAVTVSQQRLGKRLARLSPARMNEVCAALRFSLGCDSKGCDSNQ
jgi:mRNA interferase MazF